LSAKHILIFSERPPPTPEAPTTGLSVRHALMAEVLAASGFDVTYAWPAEYQSDGGNGEQLYPVKAMAFDAPDQLASWSARNRPVAVILGYWELADWIPNEPGAPLILDHIAPRLLERQFEDQDRLAGDAWALIEVLGRCDEVWVGNGPQRDMMLSWMLMAGHDCRFERPIRVVPIAGYVAEQKIHAGHEGRPLHLFHGGRDWPWRNSTAWLEILHRHPGPWKVDDASVGGGFAGHGEYLERLREADLALELCDENTERRYSQSFRMTDALCAGVPVICNSFLPLAGLVERHRAGWLLERPDDLPALLESIMSDRPELGRRAENARALALAEFDAKRIYAGLAEPLASLAEKTHGDLRKALVPPALEASSDASPGMLSALHTFLGLWADRRLRKPWHQWLSRRMSDRPMPGKDRACWVVLSRQDVFPTDHGAAVKIERTAWGLSFHLDEVILLTDRRDGYWIYRRGEREFLRFPIWPRMAGWPRAVSMLRVIARGVPYSNGLLYLPWVDRGMQYRLMWLMQRHPVEVVQGEFPAYARPAVWAARLFGSASLMVEHNVEFQRIVEQAPELGEGARKKLKKFEVETANACDRVITVSNRDRRDLVAAGVREALVHTVPHGVDLERFENAEPVDLRDRYSIAGDHAVLVYHGIYSYPPNLEAIEELSHVLLPKLRAKGYPATVVAFGPQPPDKRLPGVVFAGPVRDLAGHLKGGDLAVIPLRQGGGTRMKILDDFAARVPVVTTHKGMEGIDVEHGRQLLIFDEPDEMASAVCGLLDDPQARMDLAEAAAQWVSAFDWREIARAYVELVRGAK